MGCVPLRAELSAHGVTVVLDDAERAPHAFVTSGGVKGWLSTPQAKVGMTERGQGHGAFPVSEDEVLYAARTVSVPFCVDGGSRAGALGVLARIEAMAGGLVDLRVVDAHEDTCATGYATLDVDPEWHDAAITGTLTLVCPDPRRYGVEPSVGSMSVAPAGGGGVDLGEAGSGLAWPLDWGLAAASRSTCTVHNRGTATAWPSISVSGSMPGGFVLTDLATGRQLAYGAPVTWQGVELDCLARTASVAGVDVTRNLSARDFPRVPAGGSLTLSLFATGTGGATVTCRDTYI